MKAKYFMTVLVVGILMCGLVWDTHTVSADVENEELTCDPEYVAISGSKVIVKPTGVADTENLQCAIDTAIAYGPGASVNLSAGTFYTAQIVVNGLYGEFSGAGMGKTVITNLPNLYVAPVEFYLEQPSADNPWADLFTFTDGNFVISDLAIKITGANPTTEFSVFGLDPLSVFTSAIIIKGTETYAEIDHILLEGENNNGEYNMVNGIYYEGFSGPYPWPAITGSYYVHDSTFKHIGYATPVFNISESTVKISHNYYDDTFIAADVSDSMYTEVEYSKNKVVNSFLGFDVWDYFAEEHVGSTFQVSMNVFQSAIGIAFEQTFGEGNKCLILGNNVENTTDLGIFLGPGTSNCTVVGGNNLANVLDLGVDNILTGVNNMSSSIGLDISQFLMLRP